jgi:hypothetical protein
MAGAVYSAMYSQPVQLAAPPLAEQEAPTGPAVLLAPIQRPVGVGQAAAQLVADGLADARHTVGGGRLGVVAHVPRIRRSSAGSGAAVAGPSP